VTSATTVPPAGGTELFVSLTASIAPATTSTVTVAVSILPLPNVC